MSGTAVAVTGAVRVTVALAATAVEILAVTATVSGMHAMDAVHATDAVDTVHAVDFADAVDFVDPTVVIAPRRAVRLVPPVNAHRGKPPPPALPVPNIGSECHIGFCSGRSRGALSTRPWGLAVRWY
ncbi:hypothetical protein ABZ682_12125 [Streptomyces griseoviridis]|uniref:hypothetical protein n=1 Tax=Streptomyces griseoviridis TaxID=45398 RepID=UPI0033D8CD6A